MQFSNEVLVLILGLAGTVLGAWGYVQKRKADAALVKANADAQEANAKAQQIELDAQARLTKVQSEGDQMQGVLQGFQQQITINQQYAALLEAQRKTTESNYRVLADTQRDVGQMLLTEIQSQGRKLGEKIEAIPAKVASGNTQSLSEFAKTLAGEMAVLIAGEFERQRIEISLFPFPDPEDPDWRDEWLYAESDEVTIRKEPRFWDNAMLQKPCAKIPRTGEKVRIITGRLKDWVIVDKALSGDRCWGYIKVRDVRVGEAEKQPA